MLALKLNVPRNKPDEPSDRTIQSSGWGRENDDYSEPGLSTLCTGHKVLLIDPQASLTTFMGIDPDSLDKTLFDTLVNEEPLFILPSLHGIALAPTNITLSAAEIQLVNMDFREVRLSEALDRPR
jgi:chromosome partitioning protein